MLKPQMKQQAHTSIAIIVIGSVLAAGFGILTAQITSTVLSLSPATANSSALQSENIIPAQR